MRDDTLSNATSELAVSLQEWRTGVLNTLLVVVTVLATFAVASTVSQAVRDPSQWLAAGAFLLLYAVLLMLAVLRRINFRLRAGGLLLLGYLAGAMGLWRAGLAGDGRLYIFALPILAAILIGARSGLSMMGLSLLIYAVFTLFVHLGLITTFPAYQDNPLALSAWLDSGITLLMLLLPLVVLLWRFVRFQSNILEAERRASAEVAHTSGLLQQRAIELEETNRLLAERTEALAAAAEVARQTAALVEEQELMDRFVSLVAERYDLQYVDLFLLDDRREYAVLRSSSEKRSGYRVRLGGDDPVGQVVQSGEVAVSPVSSERALGFAPPRWRVTIPLQIGSEVVGVLDAHVESEEQPSVDRIQTLRALSDQIAVGLENARLFAQAQSRLEELQDLYQTVTSEAWRRFGEMGPELTRYQLGTSMSPQEIWQDLFAAAREGGAPVVASYEEDGGERYALVVPVALRGVVVGVVGFNRPDDLGPWQPEEIALAQRAAERVAVALENSRLFQETQRTLAEMRTLNAISSTVSRSLELDDVLEEALARALSVSGFESGLVSMVNPQTGQLELRLHRGLPEEMVRQLSQEGMEGTLCELIYRSGEPLTVEDITHGAPLDVSGLMAMGLRSYMGVPLESKGKAVGTICAFSRSPHVLQSSDLTLLQTAGQQVGVAVENAQLFEEARRRAERERLVAEIGGRLRTSLDPDVILKTTVRELGRALGATMTAVEVTGPEGADGGGEE